MNDENSQTQPPQGPILSRRSMLQGLGGLIAVAALPVQRIFAAEDGAAPAAPAAPAKPAAPKAPPLPDGVAIAKLTAYMSAAGDRELPADAIEKAKHHILDTIASMVSGADLPPAQLALKFARTYGGEKVTTIVGTNLLCGPLEAALVNGTMAQSDETDDSHASSHTHPGCAVVPAALVAGEQFGISGERFLRAVTLGYDVGTRMASALGGGKFQAETSRSTHSVGSNFGAAAAAGCAAGLDAKQMRSMIDYISQQTGGYTAWMRDLEHISKSLLFGGYSTRNGVTAAFLVKLGGTGVDDVLSGPDNYFKAMSPNKAQPARLIDKLGERYEVARTSIKKWTVGSPIQAPLDALEKIIKARPSFDAKDVQKVVVRVATTDAKTVNNRTIPDICLQHMIAVMLVDKTASFKAAHDQARMKDPAILAQRAKVELVPDEELEKLNPQRASIVEVTFNDGQTASERVEAVSGSAENPMTREEVITKCQDLMADRLGADQSKRLIDAIFNLENIKDIRELRPLLQTTS